MKSFVEFFAGVGLVREGLASQDWKCLLANDISSDKQAIYENNFGDKDFLLEDVWELAKKPDLIPDAFLYTASFPCTDLTVAGAQAGLAGNESGTLNAVLEIIRYKVGIGSEPKVVLLENVRGFLSSHKGQDIVNTVAIFNELGYVVELLELDAIDFSAQSRPRVFLVAVKSSVSTRCMTTNSEKNEWSAFLAAPSKIRPVRIKKIYKENEHLIWGSFNTPDPIPSNTRLKDIVEDVSDIDDEWWSLERKCKLYGQLSDKHKAYLDEMCSSPLSTYATAFRRMRKGIPMVELRVDGFSGCLRTPRGGSSKQILIRAQNSSWDVRLLTPRECARLQGLRDTFILPENKNKGYFAMGDAVCVPVIEYIASEILETVYQAA